MKSIAEIMNFRVNAKMELKHDLQDHRLIDPGFFVESKVDNSGSTRLENSRF